MAQAPKKKKRRKLPKNIAERSDAEVAEKLFGKKAKHEIDRIVAATSVKSIRE